MARIFTPEQKDLIVSLFNKGKKMSEILTTLQKVNPLATRINIKNYFPKGGVKAAKKGPKRTARKTEPAEPKARVPKKAITGIIVPDFQIQNGKLIIKNTKNLVPEFDGKQWVFYCNA